jgi:hypothetical protein
MEEKDDPQNQNMLWKRKAVCNSLTGEVID